QLLNAWIRESEVFDGVIDFAKMVASPDDPDQLDPAYLFENDYLHLNADGYRLMGTSIDHALFR
nr:SGNH/GDSL hydrolase family protein [Bacteroidales bacterium]